MKRASRVVARRYARALLDVVMAKPAGSGEGPAEVRAALDRARALLEEHPDLLRALTLPGVPASARKNVVAAVWAHAPEGVLRLLHLLVERDRVQILPALAEEFALAWNEARGIVPAEAVSAIELDASQKQALVAALEKASGKSVELKTRVEPSVLGGLRVNLGARTLDGTVVSQLQSLRRRLQGAA